MGALDFFKIRHKDNQGPQGTISRCILFAAYFQNNTAPVEDEFYLSKLGMHGDVYVFVDSNYIVDEELLKLQRHAKSVRYLKHDQYDFGSWKYLIRQIGLKKILEYDEIVFANNSVYLINDMSQVFDEFSKSEADFYSPCFVDEHYCGKTLTSAAYLKSFGFNDTNIMMPSFFMIFKRHLFSKQYIHKMFMDVKKENNRLDVCYNYERELTRSILRNNVLHKTSLNTIYNNSYIYTYIAFNMAKTGFPFLKKKALQQVYYDIDFIESRISGILREIGRASCRERV